MKLIFQYWIILDFDFQSMWLFYLLITQLSTHLELILKGKDDIDIIVAACTVLPASFLALAY